VSKSFKTKPAAGDPYVGFEQILEAAKLISREVLNKSLETTPCQP